MLATQSGWSRGMILHFDKCLFKVQVTLNTYFKV